MLLTCLAIIKFPSSHTQTFFTSLENLIQSFPMIVLLMATWSDHLRLWEKQDGFSFIRIHFHVQLIPPGNHIVNTYWYIIPSVFDFSIIHCFSRNRSPFSSFASVLFSRSFLQATSYLIPMLVKFSNQQYWSILELANFLISQFRSWSTSVLVNFSDRQLQWSSCFQQRNSWDFQRQ